MKMVGFFTNEVHSLPALVYVPLTQAHRYEV